MRKPFSSVGLHARCISPATVFSVFLVSVPEMREHATMASFFLLGDCGRLNGNCKQGSLLTYLRIYLTFSSLVASVGECLPGFFQVRIGQNLQIWGGTIIFEI